MSRPRWEYNENGQYYAFDEGTSNHLEEQYIRQPYATIKVPIFGAIFDINFANWTRTDVRRGQTETIRRVLPDNSIPSMLNEVMGQQKAIYVWHYNDNGYRKLDPQTNGKFERTFAKNPNAKFLIQILQQKFIVDFSAMQLSHQETGSTHQLLRLDVCQTQGFVTPKAVEGAKRNIVAGKIKAGTRITLPSERKIASMLKGIPTRPGFDTWTLRTPDIELLQPSNNLPLLRAQEYEHKSSCAICMGDILHLKTPENEDTFDDVEDYSPEFNCRVTCLPCGHIYHLECAKSAVASNPRCPSCRVPVSAVFGSQPTGTMSVSYSSESISGYRSKGVIRCSFSMDGGVQTTRHHHPGVHYGGDHREHYMPASAQGFRALRWISLAWMHYLMFAVGYSGTRNCDDVVIYNIHVKTSTTGGQNSHGWPDKTYFSRLYSEIKDAGIPLEPYDETLEDMDPAKAPEYLDAAFDDLELELL